MSKWKRSPDEEPKKEGTSDEESKEETNTPEEPKKEETSDEESKEETNTPEEPKKSSPGGNPDDNRNPEWKTRVKRAAVGATVGAAVALVGIPACIAGLGFTGAGIAAGSIAAKMMSAAAIANGGGVAAGSTVAVLQSIGAAGFSLGAKIGLASSVGSLGAGACALLPVKKGPDDKPKNRVTPSDKPEEVATPHKEPKRGA